MERAAGRRYAPAVGAGELADLLRLHAARHGVPGGAVGVLCAGEVETAHVGVVDVRTGTPVTPETTFAIGSLTKSMTATAVVLLEHDGLLSLDDPVAARVPELGGQEWADVSTLRDLMANRSLVPRSSGLEFGFDDHRGVADDALARFVATVAGYPPGDAHWSYANVGWCLLGRAIEVACADTWEHAMAELLGAAGLTDTGWEATPSTRRAHGHEVSSAATTPVDSLPCRAYSPAGTSVECTVDDLLRLAAWHLADPVLAGMRVTHADVALPGFFHAWGLGWARFDWGAGETWGWDGIVDGQRAMLRMLPSHSGAVAVVCNGSTGRAMGRDLLGELVPATWGAAVPPLRLAPEDDEPRDLTAYAGTYAWPDRRIEVTASGRDLLLTENGVCRPAVPLDERSFLVDRDDPDAPIITFGDVDGAGRPGVLYDLVWGLGRVAETH
jgi:CubicO group peptidase (beta-lactamase class C family)